jgi:hypothetical protein
MKTSVTRLDYCHYLLVRQINYPLTNFADHSHPFSHDAINRSLRGDRLTPRVVWDHGARQGERPPNGSIIFDDTVLEKHCSVAIDLVRRPYSGNAHSVGKGSGVVPCVDVNPALEQGWFIAYRISDPDGEGTSTLEHVRDMRTPLMYHQQ